MILSVLLPINKDEGYFESCLESVINQNFEDFELLILANNCSDELWSTIIEFSKKSKKIKIFRLELGGLTFALNYGLNISIGKYIARMDADDLCLPDRFKIQVEYLEKNPSTIVLGSQIILIDQNNNIISQTHKLPTTLEKIKSHSYRNNPLAHPSVIFRRKDIISIGGYKFGFYGEDYELWLRCLRNNFKIENLSIPLIYYRIHDKQETTWKNLNNIYSPVSTILFYYYTQTKKIKFLLNIFTKNKYFFYIKSFFQRL